MQLETARIGEITVIRARGRIDSVTSAEFEAAVLPAVRDTAGRVVLNLEKVEYVSSAGLRVFLLAAKQSKAAHGRFVVCAMSEAVRQVFQLSGFVKIILVVGTEAEAVATAGGPV